MDERVLKILVLQGHGLGNWIMATGAFCDIRRHYPNATIYHLTQINFAGVAGEQGCFDHVLATRWQDHYKRFPLLGSVFLLAWRNRLRNLGVDIVFDFDQTDKKITDLFYPAKLFSKKREYPHAVNVYQDIIKKAGIDGFSGPHLKWLTPSGIPRPFCVLIARSRYEREVKNWSVDKFRALALQLQKRNITPVIIGTKRDRSPLKTLRLMKKNIDLVGKIPLNHLPGIFSAAALVIGIDTGTTHMAAVVGAPTVALYGPTPVEIWGIRGHRISWIKKSRMDEISVDEVWESCQKYL